MARSDKDVWSSKRYVETAREVELSRSVTDIGEQRIREGRGLDPLVDPKSHGAKRESRNLLVPQKDGTFLLQFGTAMPVMSKPDCTGSMAGNVDIAFNSIPDNQYYLVLGKNGVLRRFHVHQATGAIQDIRDRHPLQITEFEVDHRIQDQTRLLDRERAGGDATEDYQLGLWFDAYRIEADIWKYGLKGYNFYIGDEIGRDLVTPKDLKQVFGFSDLQSPMEVVELGSKVLAKWHAFYLQVYDHVHTKQYWSRILGPERVVVLPSTEYIAEVQAAIIGLTEGVIDLQSAAEFLVETSNERAADKDLQAAGQREPLTKTVAQRIVAAVSEIPLRAQAELSGFGNIPPAGSIFASREDIFPKDWEGGKRVVAGAKDEIDWQM